MATTIATTTPTTWSTIFVPKAEAQQSVELNSEQEQWLSKLEDCESSGSTTIKILDSNNKFSYGRYMFQAETFYGQGVKYGLVPTSTNKVEPSIYDGELQKQIAHKMLLDGGEANWYNCVFKIKKLGKYPK